MVTFTEIKICNKALRYIGVAEGVTSGDGTIAGATATDLQTEVLQAAYPEALAATVESYPWAFTLRYSLLTELTPTATEHDAEWGKVYARPDNTARLWRFARSGTPAAGSRELSSWLMQDRALEDPSYRFVERSVDGSRVILAHLDASEARMIHSINNPPAADFDALFSEALAWKVVAEIAPSLTQDGEQRVANANVQFQGLVMPLAASVDANQQGDRTKRLSKYTRARRSF